jgi:PhnB protein
MTTKSIPEGYSTATPSLTMKDSVKAIEFYKKALGAEVIDHMLSPDGNRTMHATIRIGNSILMMGDEMGDPSCRSAESMGGSPISLYLYVPNADESFKRAISAGATETMPVTEMFWGDRAGGLKDPFGYHWMIATHTRNLSKDEIQKGAKAFFEQMKKSKK